MIGEFVLSLYCGMKKPFLLLFFIFNFFSFSFRKRNKYNIKLKKKNNIKLKRSNFVRITFVI